MARRIARKSQEQALMERWWIRASLTVVFISLAYGFASLAIDSGNWLEYIATIVLLWWAVKHGYRAFRYAFFS